ncbi:hypothetical protein K438DRAFT_1967786 [Mycena galopus ATCC 62051]|nr:hypothetical protein K438DRAFT_1967786 [Mycena galopus ATCC 62051]
MKLRPRQTLATPNSAFRFVLPLYTTAAAATPPRLEGTFAGQPHRPAAASVAGRLSRITRAGPSGPGAVENELMRRSERADVLDGRDEEPREIAVFVFGGLKI